MDESTDIDVETVTDAKSIKTPPETINEENSTNTTTTTKTNSTEKQKFVKLPLARVKNIMKMDPDCTLISQDALLLVTKATEMFIELLAKESVKQTSIVKRKTMLKRDVECAINSVPHLCFLDGALE